MTNYEWLIETGKIYDFIYDVMFSTVSLFSGKYDGLKVEEITSQNKMIVACVDWLKEEHKEMVLYVPFSKVEDIMQGVTERGLVSFLCGQKILNDIKECAKKIEE